MKTMRKKLKLTRICFRSLSTFTVSIISRVLIFYVIYIETMYYLDSKLIFKFKPDTDMDTKLKIHIDVTVATPCSSNFNSTF